MKERNRLRRWACGVFATVVVLTALAVAAGWRARTTEQLLERADAEMERDPKRALAMLDSLDRDRLCGAAQEAKFALLYTQAQDKNYIDETNDSLIRAAADYFESHGEVRDRFRALYYRGRVHVNRGEYSRAMIAFMEAEMLVGELDDCYLAGLLYVQMGNIYKRYYDYPKALDAYRTAYAYYLNTDRELHQYHVLLDVALMYFQLKDYANSESFLKQVLSYAVCRSDKLLCEYCYGNLIILYNEQQRFVEADSLLDGLFRIKELDRIESSTLLASLAYLYAFRGNVRLAKDCLAKASKNSDSQNDLLDLSYYNAIVSYQLKEYRTAYVKLVESTVLQDSLLRHVLQQPILSTQRDFLMHKLHYQAYRIQVRRRLMFFYVLITSLLVSMTLYYLFVRLRRKDEEICRFMEMLENQQRNMHREHSMMEKQIHALFRRQFQLFNELGCVYYEHSTAAGRKDRIFREVDTRIKQLAEEDSASFHELENIVNCYQQNAMTYLRVEFPNLKMHELHHLCFLFAGFVPTMISVLLHVRIGTVYKRASRLKLRIQNSAAPHKELFLKLMDKPLVSDLYINKE